MSKICPSCNKQMDKIHNLGTTTLYRCKEHGDIILPNKKE